MGDYMFILEANICEKASFLATVLFFKKLVTIISIIVPILLILLITIDITKAVMASDDTQMKRAQKLAIKRIIWGIVIFFVPLTVDAVFSLFDEKEVAGITCYNNATDAAVDVLQQAENEKLLAYEDDIQALIDAANESKAERDKELAILREKAKTINSGGNGDTPISASSGSEAIALTAEKLAWPKGTKKSKYVANHRHDKFTSWSQLGTAKPTKAFMDAMDRVYPNHFKWGTGYPAIRTGQSCDTFVGVVVKASGYDAIGRTYGHLQKAFRKHKTKWQKVDKAGRGDVCLKGGHAKIYLGKNKIAQASYGTHFGFITRGGCGGSSEIWRAKK